MLYPAKHGRLRQSPWSMRKLSIYQKLDINLGDSKWIFLQAPEEVQCTVTELASQYAPAQHSLVFLILLLTVVLSWTEANWVEYIQWLEKKLVEKARTNILLDIMLMLPTKNQ